jgi:hypothetical protein
MRDESQEASALDNLDCEIHLSKILGSALASNFAKFSNKKKKKIPIKEQGVHQVFDQILIRSSSPLERERKKERK